MGGSIKNCCKEVQRTHFVSRFVTYNSYFLFGHGTKGLIQRHVISNLARGKCSPNYKYLISSLVPIFHHSHTREKQPSPGDKSKEHNHQGLETESYLIRMKNKRQEWSVLPQRSERGSQSHITVRGDNSNYCVHIYESGHTGFF